MPDCTFFIAFLMFCSFDRRVSCTSSEGNGNVEDLGHPTSSLLVVLRSEPSYASLSTRAIEIESSFSKNLQDQSPLSSKDFNPSSQKGSSGTSLETPTVSFKERVVSTAAIKSILSTLSERIISNVSKHSITHSAAQNSTDEFLNRSSNSSLKELLGSSSANSFLPTSTSHLASVPTPSASLPYLNASSNSKDLSSLLSLQSDSSVNHLTNRSSLSADSSSFSASLIGSGSSLVHSAIHSSSTASLHWMTVTVCPWDTLYTASIVPSSVSSSMSKFVPPSTLSSLSTSLPSLTVSGSLSISPFLNFSSISNTSFISIVPASSWVPHTVPSYSIVSNQSDIKPIAIKGCDVILDGLSQVMGKMTSCIISNLKPMEVCGKCTKYHSALKRYQGLIANTPGCNKKLVLEYNAQYQAIPKMYKVQDDMWQDFECEKCYKERTDSDPNAAWIPKEEFVKTKSLVQEIMVCFANYSKDTIDLPYPVMLNISKEANETSWKSNANICIKCKEAYRKLKKYMKSIHFEGSAEKRWCADMVYGFNETRRIWGQFCVSPREDQESIIALTCFFCFLPVIFYVGTKLHSDVKERKNESRVNYESD